MMVGCRLNNIILEEQHNYCHLPARIYIFIDFKVCAMVDYMVHDAGFGNRVKL